MPLYEDDQATCATLVNKGTHTSVNAAQLKAACPPGTVYTFTKAFNHVYNGQHLGYRKGVSYYLDPTLKAALLALGAPMVAA